MFAVLVNALVVVLGGWIGARLKGGIPERFRVTVNQALGLCVLLIGIAGAVKTANVLIVILSMALGAVLGEALKLEQRLERLGNWAQGKFARGDAGFAEGFVSATLLFCVGAMAVVGSLEAGLNGRADTLLAKSALDGVSSLIFASTLGPGVMLSALPLLVYQGGIALLAARVGQWLSDPVILEMSATGSVLIIGLGLNMLGAVKERVRVGNMLPAMLLPIALLPLYEWIAGLL